MQKQRPEGYQPEVTVQHTCHQNSIELSISGRIDGVFTEDQPVIIEEIKTTLYVIESLPDSMRSLHLAQAKVYAYLYCLEHELEQCQIQMTYFHIEKKTQQNFCEPYTLEVLESFFDSLIQYYLTWLEKLVDYQEQRNQSIQELEFPYGKFRPGQRELAVAVYRTITHQKQLITQAPTGIGKTVSTLFPAVKAIGENQHDIIFYLTAKTLGRALAEDTLADMGQHGLILKSLTLTAKDKICFCKMGEGYSEAECPYTKGYYDRLPAALNEFFCHDHFTRPVIERLAKQHEVCPFEYSLDLALWMDVIIGDYNHVFHPSASLKRFQEDKKYRKTLLIDEAHNLVDRARDMFSASLPKQQVMRLHRITKPHHPLLAKPLNRINRDFLTLKKACLDQEEGIQQWEKDCYFCILQPDMEFSLLAFCGAFEQWLLEESSASLEVKDKDELMDFYFQARQFLRICEMYDDHFVTLIQFFPEYNKQEMEITLYCLDPSQQLQGTYKLSHGSIFFSATLLPFSYYIRVLGIEEEPNQLTLPSPFPPANFGVFVSRYIKATYAQRAHYYDEIADLILSVTQCHPGNYLICFPSYQFLKAVKELVESRNRTATIIEQTTEMDELARREFLKQFSESKHQQGLLGFAIMGGLFGEAIDLPGAQLIGVIVVSVGLPQICLERELIKDYFDGIQWPGFAFAYQYPGMNRVLQTAGRVIRSSSDHGIVVLVDERFAQYRYRQLFPPHWQYTITTAPEQLKEEIQQFWNRH